MPDASVALVAALGAAALTAMSSLGVVWLQEWRRAKADDADALGQAVTEMLSRSLALGLRIRTMAEAAKLRSGLAEGVDVTFRIRKPLEILDFHDWLQQDWAPLNAAWSEIWSRGDQELLTAANLLMTRCQELIDAASMRQPAPTVRSQVWRVVIGDRWTPETLTKVEEAQGALGRARRDFAVAARAKLGRQSVEPFED